MNYDHHYHAGNFADVFKHVVLISILKSLQHKPNPFCGIETHAGSGIYDLEQLENIHEYHSGIAKIYNDPQAAIILKDYLDCITHFNKTNLQHYPGSPAITQFFLRPQDKLILSELNDKAWQNLKKNLRTPHVAIHHQDGYQSLKAFLPPQERRGFVLIDPPYESTHEFDQLLKIIPEALKRWETGIYMLWYPIKNRSYIERFKLKLGNALKRPYSIIEMTLFKDDVANRFNGSGMVLINPPWKLKEGLVPQLNFLNEKLSNSIGKISFLEFN